MIATKVAVPPRISLHPAPDVLRDFMAGKLAWEDTKRIVRHLLAGCRLCSQVAGRIWAFTEEALDPTWPLGEGDHDS